MSGKWVDAVKKNEDERFLPLLFCESTVSAKIIIIIIIIIIIESMIRRTLPWMVSIIFPKGARCYHGMAAS